MKPYYDDGSVQIWHGDCRDALPREFAPVTDLLLADPPYNVGIEYDGHGDSMPPHVYLEWTQEWFGTARALTRRQLVFPGHGNLPMWLGEVRPKCAGVGCWYKPGSQASSILGNVNWEPWLFWHGGDKGLLGGSDTVECRPETRDLGHPCPKPVDLIRKLLIKTRAVGVVDPFLGSGTTLRAAKDLGIPAIGIEQSEVYCEIAAKRLAQEVLDFGASA